MTQKTNVEVVFLVDGSDSFDRTKIEGEGVTEMGGVKRRVYYYFSIFELTFSVITSRLLRILTEHI